MERENLQYESVYFKELHNDREYYRPTIYSVGAAVVSTITSVYRKLKGLERVNVSHLGGSWGMLPQQIFNFKPSEIAGNAFKTNMVWWNLHTFKNKKSRYKKKFSTKSCVALIGVLVSSKQHKELGPACQSWREFSYPSTLKITIQIHHFAETYGKQTLKGILLRYAKNVLSAHQIPFLYLTKAKRRFQEP